MQAGGETLDTICGDIRILQPVRGERFTLDPLLLAHFAAAHRPRGKTVDLGTGSGVIALVLARRFGRQGITALELQPRLYALAARNVALNGLEREVAVVLGDLRHAARTLGAGAFAQVVCNPPYHPCAAGPPSAHGERAIARSEVACSLGDVAASAALLLREGGELCLSHRAGRLAELLEALRARRLEPRRLRLVHPRVGRPATVALVGAVKGGRGELEVEPPLYLHLSASAELSPEVRRMIIPGP
ncbi:MAG TPA: methyltransferase [Myxococcaceae bacterium]|jgi:tRNA1(Val) A37 N6-methylase TrmN6